MAAMMPSSGNDSSNPYARYDAPVEDDLIDPDDGTPCRTVEQGKESN
jgi:hypothetical protein